MFKRIIVLFLSLLLGMFVIGCGVSINNVDPKRKAREKIEWLIFFMILLV
jgi:hypothetical protein